MPQIRYNDELTKLESKPILGEVLGRGITEGEWNRIHQVNHTKVEVWLQDTEDAIKAIDAWLASEKYARQTDLWHTRERFAQAHNRIVRQINEELAKIKEGK